MVSVGDGRAVLVVEDEEAVREGLCDVLAYHGYAPDGVATGGDGLRRAIDGSYAAVVLDVMLPEMNGFDVCREIRAHSIDVPILMLTAKGSEDDVITGFRCGADDYMTKPFSIRELVARIGALCRRARRHAEQDARTAQLQFGPWSVDVAGLRASVGGEVIDLTPRELALLEIFVRERGRIVSRRTLLAEVWGKKHAALIRTRTVDMHIAKLRKKIDRADDSLIETIRGAGYRARI